MRVAALYDIHGNLPALEAVLRDVTHEGVDLIVVGGDVVPGPMVHESLAALRALAVPLVGVCGNGEREALTLVRGADAATIPASYRATMEWSSAQLTESDSAMIAQWPATQQLHVEALGQVLFCHATPYSDNVIFTKETPAARLEPVFAAVDAHIVVCGHTHMPFDRRVGSTRIVNAGSVGMPFGDPRACWLLLGPHVELRRVSYDREEAARRILDTSYPGGEQFVQRFVRATPSEREMLDQFAAVALQ